MKQGTDGDSWDAEVSVAMLPTILQQKRTGRVPQLQYIARLSGAQLIHEAHFLLGCDSYLADF